MFSARLFTSLFTLIFVFSNQGFTQWQAQNPGLPEGFAPVYSSVINENTVWVVGGHEVNKTPYAGFSKTIDGGLTWTADSIVADDLQNFRFSSIFALDDSIAWVTMNDDITSVHRGRIFKTMDGGESWVHQSTAYPDDAVKAHTPVFVYFYDEYNGLAGGYYGENYTTSDGGNLWTVVPPEKIPALIGDEQPFNTNVWPLGDSTAWYGTSKGRIFKTTDRGYSWTDYDVGLGESTVFVSFKDALNGLATTPILNKNIAKTTDGGKTWQTLDQELPVNAILIYLRGTENTYMYGSGDLPTFIGSDPGSGFTTDEGKTWLFENDMPLDPVFTVNSSVGWSVSSTYDANIYKWTGGSLDSLDKGRIENRTIMVDGLQRSYILFIPSNYKNYGALPLVINYHGYTSSAESQMNNYSKMNDIADTAHFIVVYPQGLPAELLAPIGLQLPKAASGWNIPGLVKGEQDDVVFTDQLIDSLMSEYTIDPTRIYAMGFSNGSYMAFQAAYSLPNRIASVAGVSGGLSYSMLDSIHLERPLSFLSINGTDDPLVPYDGLEGWSPSAEYAPSYWSNIINECPSDSIVTELPDTNTSDGSTVQIIQFNNCNYSTEVLFYKIENGGHSWPGSGYDIEILGKTNMDFSASTEIWNFFKRNPMPDISTFSEPINEKIQTTYELFQNYPNPFYTTTNIVYALNSDNEVVLTVFDITGREIASLVSENQQAGRYVAIFDASNLSGGVYICILRAGGFEQSRKMLLLR